MTDGVFQQDRYDGVAREVAEWWTLKKGQHGPSDSQKGRTSLSLMAN